MKTPSNYKHFQEYNLNNSLKNNGKKPEKIEILNNLSEMELEQIINPINQPQQSLFLEYYRILLRRKWLVLFCLFAVFIPVTLYTFKATPIYEAEATIIYDEPRDTMFALDVGQPFYNKSAILNMIEQLKSRTLAKAVANALPDEIKDIYKGKTPLSAKITVESIIAKILPNNIFARGVRGSDVIKISVRAPSSLAAQIIANTYVDRIIESNLQKKREEISNIHKFIERQVEDFKGNLALAEEALRDFKEQNNLISLNETSAEVLGRLTEAEVAYNQNRTELEALEQRRNYIEARKKELLPSFSLTTNPKAEQLKQTLIDQEMEYSRLKLQDRNENRISEKLKNEIHDTKQQLVHELMQFSMRENVIDPLSQFRNLLQESITLDVDLVTYRAREQSLKKIINQYNRDLQRLPKKELELVRLVRDKEVNDKIYSMLLEKREEARITKAGKIGDIRIVDPAETPLNPIEPNKRKNLAMGLVLGIGLGIGLALFLDSLDTTIKSQEDVEKLLQLPVLSAVPKIDTSKKLIRQKQSSHSNNGYSSKLLTSFLDVPHLYEAHQNFLLNFDFVNIKQTLKCIVVTSPGQGEGKTLNSINIAQLYTRKGKKTLLIDCDLRRPMLHKILELQQEPGLSQVLIDKIDLENAIQIVKRPYLEVLTSGTLPPNASDILNTNKMKEIIEKCKQYYNLIILDSPPVIAVTDPIVLSKKADGTLLIVRSFSTKSDLAFRCKKILENSGANLFGVVINDVNFKNVYGYYQEYYYSEKQGKKRRRKQKRVS